MKKKLREQLTVLAKQIIEEENKLDTTSMKEKVAELYGKLAILEYLENQLAEVPQPHFEESLDSKSFREENWFIEPEPVPQPDHKEDLIEPLMEKIKDIVAQMPEESERIDELLDKMLPHDSEKNRDKTLETHDSTVNKKPVGPEEGSEGNSAKPPISQTKNDLEEFASHYQRIPEFERKTKENFPKSDELKPASKTLTESRSRSLNDTINKGLNIGLNDRLAFIKHLFEGQAEDYTRVLSQINTMSSFEEAEKFIKGKIKPDYNHWTNKEEYSERFLAAVEKKFN